jgi:hypothetical protein
MPFVAIKMGRRQGARRAHPAPFYAPADLILSRRYQNGAGRNRRATQPAAHFHRNPLGRGRLAVFPRCSLLTSRTIFALGGEAQISRTAKMVRDARRSRLEKQPTDLRRKTRYFGDRTLVVAPFVEDGRASIALQVVNKLLR